MSPSRARYVTACQQLLALGVVVIALVPATRVVSLDVVGVGPGTQPGPTIAAPLDKVANQRRVGWQLQRCSYSDPLSRPLGPM